MAKKTETVAKKYRDHTITLNADMSFDITGPMVTEKDRAYPDTAASFAEAVEKIDRWTDRRTKQKRAEATLNLPVLTEDGNLVHIKGIHSARGTYLFAEGEQTDSDFHPNLPWIEALLKERAKLSERVSEINRTIRPFEMRAAYGRVRGDYDEVIKELIERHAELLREAVEAGKKVKA